MLAKKGTFLKKGALQLLPPHIQICFFIFWIKIKLCIIFIKEGRAQKQDAVFARLGSAKPHLTSLFLSQKAKW